MARLSSELVLSLTDRVSGPARGVGRSLDTLDRKQRAVASRNAAFDALNRNRVDTMGLMRRQNAMTADSVTGIGTASRMALASAAGVMAPIAGGLAAKEVVTAAADFQASMNRVRAALQTTGPEFTKLSDMAKDFGASTQFSANEAALAIEMLGKNGLNASQIMGGALKTSMDIAAASGSDLSASADVVTDVMANFKLQAKDLTNVADGMTGVLLQSKFGFEDYRLALGQAGGVAGGLGVTMADFNSTIAATSSAFASGSDAGTSFKTFLSRLIPASKPAAKAMKKLGLEFFESNGKMKTMGKIAEELKTGLSGLSDETRNEALQDIFGTDAIRTAIGLAEEGAAGLLEVQGKIAKASAKAQADARMEGFWGEWEKTKSALEGLNIEIGTSGLGGLETALKGAQSLIGDMQTGVKKFKSDLNMEEIGIAASAVADLGKALTDLVGIDTSQAAIPKFMAEMADTANKIAAAINTVNAFFRKPAENFGNETITPEKQAAIKAMQPAEQYDPGGTMSYRDWLQAKREREKKGGTEPLPQTMSPDPSNIPAVNATSTPTRQATAKARRARGPQGPMQPKEGGFGGYGPQYPAIPTSRPEIMPPKIAPRIEYVSAPSVSTVPVPSPRPDIVGPVTVEGEAAAAKAAEIGGRISSAFSVTATPTINTGSIDAAKAKVDALAASLRSIPGLAAQASESARSARVDYDGLHADMTN